MNIANKCYRDIRHYLSEPCGAIFYRWIKSLALVLALTSSTFASDVLRYMPEDALGFVLINDLEKVNGEVERFTKLFGLPIPAPLTLAQFTTGLSEGIQKRGDLLVALLPGPPESPEPQPMVLLPVADYAKFASSIHGDASGEICRVSIAGEDVLSARFGEYAILMDVGHRETLDLLLGLQQAPVASLKPLQSWLREKDVVAVVMPRGVEDLLELGRGAIKNQREQFAKRFRDPSYSALLEQMERNAEFSQWILGVLDSEVSLVALAATLDEQLNLSVSKRVLTKEGGKLSRVAAAIGTTASTFEGFSEQPFVMTGGGPLPEGWDQALAKTLRTIDEKTPKVYGLEELDGDQWNTVEEFYYSLFNGLNSVSINITPGEQGDSFFSNVYLIMKTDDSSDYLQSCKKAVSLRNESMSHSTTDIKYDFEVTDKIVGSAQACEIVADIAIAAQDPNVPTSKWLLESMFGEDGKMRQLLVATDKHTLVYGMANEEQMIPLIDDVKERESGLSESANVQETMKLIRAEAPWKLLVSPPGCVKWAKRFMNEFFVHLIGETPTIPDFDSCPPIGLAVSFVDARVESDLVFPVDTLKALAAYISKCQEL